MVIPSDADLIKELEKTSIVKTLTSSEKNQILKTISFIRYKRGETVYKQGHPINEFSILMRGLLKLSIENNNNDRGTIISIQGPLSVIGVSTLFDPNYQATAESMSEALIAIVKKETLIEILNTNPRFAVAILKLNAEAVKRYMHQIADFGQKQIRARIASVIVKISDLVGGNFIDIQISRNELAEYAGISTGSTIRLLSTLEKEGLIVLDKKTIEIKDKEKLVQVSEGLL